MGGVSGYARPVEPVDGRISSWRAHTERYVPSTEPGVDYYVPTGTPVRAASSGRIVDVGGSIYAATGRYVTIDLDDGRRVRYLHLLRSHVSEGDRVQWGQVIADSGASGYGSDFFGEPSRNDAFYNNTGGDHVHMTLWAHQEYTFGRYATLDPEIYMADEAEEDDMFTDEDRERLNATYAGVFGARNITDKATPVSWKNIGGGVQKANYGILPITIHNQTLIAKQSGQIAAINEVVQQLATANGAALDLGAIERAAERGARAALDGLVIDAGES